MITDHTRTDSIVEFANRTRKGFAKKADRKKLEALVCFLMIIGATLVAPLFVTLGNGMWLGKIIPSALSLLAAGATAWLQLRKPQQLWTMYRSAQREIEDAVTRYNYKLRPFETETDPDKLLAEKVADIAIGIHHQWVPLVPNPENLKLAEKSHAERKHEKQLPSK